MNRWSVVSGVIMHVILGSACASKVQNGGGSETGFLACADDTECGAGQTCVEQKCVDQSNRTALVTATGPAGTCDDPQEFSASMPSWWQAEWTPSLPSLPRPGCGFVVHPDWDAGPAWGTAPAIVAKWIAPSDGTYWAETYSRDMSAVSSITPQCGGFDACGMLVPQDVPDPPFDSIAIHGDGDKFDAKAGDVWYFSFQYWSPDGGAPPDQARVIATVRPY